MTTGGFDPNTYGQDPNAYPNPYGQPAGYPPRQRIRTARPAIPRRPTRTPRPAVIPGSLRRRGVSSPALWAPGSSPASSTES